MYQDTGWQHESSMPSFLNVERIERPLRPHQEKAIAMLRQSIARGNKRVVIQLPTGAGKTRLAAEIVNGSLSKGNRAAFTVPMISLIDQTCDAFENEGIHDIGVIQSSHWRTNYAAQVQVASVQSLIRRSFPEAKIVLVDECHVRAKAIEDWMEKCPETIFVGLSATPWAKGMAEQWDDLICPVTMQELIDDGFLSKFVVYTPDHPDLKGIKTVAGDYHEGQLSERMQDTVLVANIVETWKQLGENEPTLVFAVDRAHARKLVGKFAEAGINMGYCDANVDRVGRQMLFERMARGELAGIVNIATLTTGVDADVRCIVLARPTKSAMLQCQIIGRGLRTAKGKERCIILDHAGNHDYFGGYVTDLGEPELLSGKVDREQKQKEKNEEGQAEGKNCPKCGAWKPPKVSICPSCGFKPERQSDIEEVEGRLKEFKPKKKKGDGVDKERFYRELLGYAALKGKSESWTLAMFKNKFDEWPHRKHGVEPITPTPQTISYIRSRNISYAKSKRRGG